MDRRSHWIRAPGNEQNPERAPSMGVKPTNPDPKNILGKRLELDPTLHPPLRALPPSFPNHSGKIWDCGWKTLPLERIKSGNFFLLGRKINPAHSRFFFWDGCWRFKEFNPSVGWKFSSSSSSRREWEHTGSVEGKRSQRNSRLELLLASGQGNSGSGKRWSSGKLGN